MPSQSRLVTLILRGNELDDDVAPALLRLGDKAPLLRNLDVSENALRDRAAEALAAGVFSSASELTRVTCRWNAIGDAGTVALLEALSSAHALVHLDLSMNRLGSMASEAIGAALKIVDGAPCVLDVSQNRIPSAAMQSLVEGMEAYGGRVSELRIGFNPLGREAMEGVISALDKCKNRTRMSMLAMENAAAARTEFDNQWIWDRAQFAVHTRGKGHPLSVPVEFPERARKKTYKKFPTANKLTLLGIGGATSTYSLDDSVFVKRKSKSESKWYYDTVIHTKKTFRHIWKLLAPKMSRLIPDRDSRARLKSELRKYFPSLWSVWRHYAVGTGASDCLTLGNNEFIAFLDDIDAADDHLGGSLSIHEAQVCFVAADYDRQTEKKNKVLNPDNALVREEFIDTLVRLSMLKYCRENSLEKIDNPASAFAEFMNVWVLPRAESYCANTFRNEELYWKDIDMVMKRFKVILDETFAANEIGGYIVYERWMGIVNQAGLLSHRKLGLSRMECCRAFSYAQMYQKKNDPTMCKLSREEYYEALVLLAEQVLPEELDLPEESTLLSHKLFLLLGASLGKLSEAKAIKSSFR